MRTRLALLALAAALLLSGAGPASALSVTYELNFEFSGGIAPEGAAPWVTITIDDAADAIGANGVRVTISNVGLTDEEFVDLFHLNFDPALDPTLLAFTVVDASAVAGNISFSTGVDAFMADGDGLYDILVDLPPPPGTAKFMAGESIVFDVSYTSAITASSFDFLSEESGGQGTFHAAALVQGIGEDDEGSGWIGDVPEPAVTLLLAVGLAGLAAAGRRRT